MGNMNIAYALADLVSKPSPPPPGGWLDDLGPEAFGALDEDGRVYVIGYKGEWYHRLDKPKWNVRLHNWLLRVGARFDRWGSDG